MDKNIPIPSFVHQADEKPETVFSLGSGIIPEQNTMIATASFLYTDQQRFNHSGSPVTDPAVPY